MVKLGQRLSFAVVTIKKPNGATSLHFHCLWHRLNFLAPQSLQYDVTASVNKRPLADLRRLQTPSIPIRHRSTPASFGLNELLEGPNLIIGSNPVRAVLITTSPSPDSRCAYYNSVLHAARLLTRLSTTVPMPKLTTMSTLDLSPGSVPSSQLYANACILAEVAPDIIPLTYIEDRGRLSSRLHSGRYPLEVFDLIITRCHD